MERGEKSHPCCINAPKANQNEFKILNSLTAACWGTDTLGICSSCSPITVNNFGLVSRLIGMGKDFFLEIY